MPTTTARFEHPLRWLLLFAGVHFILSLVAVEVRSGFSNDAMFWGLAGLTTAVVAQAPQPWRSAVVGAVVLSCGTVYLLIGEPISTALGFAVANAGPAIVAGEILRRRLPQGRRIVRMRDIGWLGAAAIAGGLAGSGLGALTQFIAEGSLELSTAATWLMANVVGILVGAPVFLALFSLKAEPPPMPRWVPTLVAVASTAVVVVGSTWASSATSRNFSYLVIVPVMVSAVWLGQRHTALLVGGLALSLAVATGRGVGPFAATDSMFDPLLAAQVFMAVVQFTALVVGVEASRRRDVIAELDGILAATVEGVLVVDDIGVIRHNNAGAEAILAASQGQLIGMELGSLVACEVSDDDESLNLTLAQRVDGSEFWAEVSRGKIFERSGRRRTAVVVRDVTARIETEESVRRIQDEFVSNMTHELKTPLTAIIGFSDWMLSDPDTPNSAEDLEVIRDSALSMKTLIDDILDFKRISGADAATDAVDLGAIVESSVNVVFAAAKDKSIEISLDVGTSTAVLGDVDQLQSAVQNLISNAVKYSNPGGLVRVRLREESGQAVLSVEDEGIGIPEADQENLFVRFFRAGNTGDIHGTGLGLALVRQVVEGHGGSVDLASSLGEGTTVTLRLPATSLVPKEEGSVEPVATKITEPAI
jgi:PAS domain S-box-containing protein